MADVSTESEKTRAEVAEYLREFADELSPRGEGAIDDGRDSSRMGQDRTGTEDARTGDAEVGNSREAGDRTTDDRTATDRKVTVIAGNESATIVPPESLSFAVEVDSEDSLLGGPTGERGVTFSLGWSSDDVETDDELGVE